MKPILKHEISNKREHSQRLGLQLMILPVALLGLAFAATNPLCSKITIRKEANDVSDSEWRMIVDTIQKAQRTPDSEDPTISVWEAGADLHKDLSANPSERIHDSCMFLFWHRVFLVEMEKNLQKINPDFFFPYWDSAKQWGDVENAPIWNYLGRKGSPVENDIFNNVPFKLPGEEKPLARSTEDWNKALFTAQFYDRLTRKSITDKTGFGVWHEDVEGSHGILHVEIGGSEGQMSMMASPLDPLFYLHHGNIDYLWLQAQVQWKAKDFPQYAGVKADGTTCVPTDVIPKYDITLEQAVELQKLCVDYAKPVFLAKDDTDVTVVPQSIPDASAASEGVSSEVVSEQPSPRTNAPRGNTRALEVPSSTSVAVARSIVAEQNLKTASAAGKPKRTKTVRPIPSTTTSVTRSVPTHLSDRRLRGKEPKKFDARPSRARGYSPQGTTTTTTTTTCTSSTTTTTTTCTLWELEASSTPTVRSYDEQDSTDSYGFIKGEMGHGRGISDRDRKPHPRRRPRRFNNEPAYAVADGTIFMAAAKGEKSKKGSKAKKSKGSKGNNILIPGSSKGASYAIDDADEDDKPEYVKPPTQGNATKVRNRRFSPDDVDQICPRKVPMSWIKMQGGDTAKLVFIQDKLQITCQKLVVDLKSGKFLEALPEFDHGERPMITPCDEAVVPKSTRKRKHVQAYVSPNEMANIDAQSGTFMETPLVGLMAILAFFTG